MMEDTTTRASAGRALVTGATGAVGGALTDLLVGGDLPFRVMSRRPQQVASFRARGIEAVQGDFEDPSSVRRALEGCEQLFLLPPFTPALALQARRAIDAARAAGVRHVVKISAADANPRSPLPWAAAHARADAHLAESGLAWTRLRPSAFMGGLLQLAPLIRRGLLPGTSGDGATTWIDSGDIAAAAARVLSDRGAQGGTGDRGRDHLLTGTQPLSFPQVASILTDQLGRRVRYLHVPAPLVYLGMRAARMPRTTARGAVAQFSEVVRRGLDDVRVYSKDLEELIGRPALDLPTWVRQHRAAFTR